MNKYLVLTITLLIACSLCKNEAKKQTLTIKEESFSEVMTLGDPAVPVTVFPLQAKMIGPEGVVVK